MINKIPVASQRSSQSSISNIINDTKPRASRFQKLLTSSLIDLDQLKKLGWSGISPESRANTWLVLLQILPVSVDQWQTTLNKRLASYRDLVHQFWTDTDPIPTTITPQMQITLKQIRKDAPRTQPGIALFQQTRLQEMIIRILYIWAIRHPATGYVQGINDLLTPFIFVFFSEKFSGDFHQIQLDAIDADTFELMESKCFHCLTKIMDLVPDMFLFGQPGIQRMIYRLEQLIKRIDVSLHQHFTNQGLQFVQFAFRWMNCFLIREMPLDVIVRIWDTYLCDESNTGFTVYHVYVSAALLMFYAPHLKTLEFQDLMLFLQNLPTKQLSSRDIDSILSQSFVYQSIFNNTKF